MDLNKEIYLTKQEFSFTLEENVLLQTFVDPYVYQVLYKHNAFLVGGAITSIFSNSKINDLDIYFRTEDDYNNCLNELLKISRAKHESNSAVTFPRLLNIPVQLIKKVIRPTIQEIFDEFDFTVCMGGYDFQKKEFVFHHDFFKHLAQRELVFNTKSKNPIHALLRVEKYKSRGYTFKQKELYKIIGCIIAMKITTNEDMASLLEGMYNSRVQSIVNNLRQPESLKEDFDFVKFLQLIEDSFYPAVELPTISSTTLFAEPLPF